MRGGDSISYDRIMADESQWAFPKSLQPKPESVRFDLQSALDAVVAVRAEIPEEAFTASILGTVRSGNGVVIRDDGLVLTIGYLVTEAETVWLTLNSGQVVPAHPIAYDQVTGFGLVMPLGDLGVAALPCGSAQASMIGDDVIVVGHGGRPHALNAQIVAKREFAGYWEYLLDEALFTAPAHPEWGGAALLDARGRLIGVGSLLVQESIGDQNIQGNMIVPIDLLAPILEEMLRLGRADRPPRPWLGLYATDASASPVVRSVAEDGPADRVRIQTGDRILEVAGERVASLADLYRKTWALGAAGVEVPLTLAREGEIVRVHVRSADRSSFLKKPRLH
jgi:S1-C subfamily serine protease